MHSFFFSGNSYSCKVKQARKSIGSFNVYKEVEAKLVYLLVKEAMGREDAPGKDDGRGLTLPACKGRRAKVYCQFCFQLAFQEERFF